MCLCLFEQIPQAEFTFHQLPVRGSLYSPCHSQLTPATQVSLASEQTPLWTQPCGYLTATKCTAMIKASCRLNLRQSHRMHNLRCISCQGSWTDTRSPAEWEAKSPHWPVSSEALVHSCCRNTRLRNPGVCVLDKFFPFFFFFLFFLCEIYELRHHRGLHSAHPGTAFRKDPTRSVCFLHAQPLHQQNSQSRG